MSERWLYAWALGAISFGGASLLVPLYIVELGATPFELGLLAATAASIGAPGAILFGRLANRVGHRRGLVLATLATIAAALAVIPVLDSVAAVIVANAALWLVVAAVAPVLTMLVVDGVPEAAWSERIGRLNKYQGYGWAGGLVLGAAWPLVGPRLVGSGSATRALFVVLAGCAAASALAAARTLPRPARTGSVVESRRQERRLARIVAGSRRGIKGATFVFTPNRLYWSTRNIRPRRLLGKVSPALGVYLLAAAFFFVGSAAFWAPLPLLFTETGFSTGDVFALYLASSLASAVLYEVVGRLAAAADVRLLQTGALAGRALLFPAVALATGLVGAAGLGAAGLALGAIGATWAVIAVVGTAIVTRLAPPSVRGEVLGVYTALGAVAGGIGGVLGGWVAGFGYLVAFGVAGGFVLVGALLVLSLHALSGRAATLATVDEPTVEAGD
jgi:MFS family permease